MQFRQKTHRDKDGNIRQGQTVQLMRYTYDAENKRGRQVMIGSFKVEDPRLPPEVEALLTPQEKAEFEEWKRAQQQAVAREEGELDHVDLDEAQLLADGYRPVVSGSPTDAVLGLLHGHGAQTVGH